MPDRLTLLAFYHALTDFYYGCPDDRAWRKNKKLYLEVWREMKALRRILFRVETRRHAL